MKKNKKLSAPSKRFLESLKKYIFDKHKDYRKTKRMILGKSIKNGKYDTKGLLAWRLTDET